VRDAQSNTKRAQVNVTAYTEIGTLKTQINELNTTLQTEEAALAGGNTRFLVLQGDFDQFKAGAQEAGIAAISSECPQDLSEIDGIGSVFEQRLYDSGIGTYWEVAHLSDAELRTALKLDDVPAKGRAGNRVLQVNGEAIRADALRLAESTQTQGRTWTGGQADDFEPIEGIGRVFELRLFNAGICTYEALMNTDADRLAEICNSPKRFKTPNYAGWIAEAKAKAASKIEAKPVAKSTTSRTRAPKPATPGRKRTSK